MCDKYMGTPFYSCLTLGSKVLSIPIVVLHTIPDVNNVNFISVAKGSKMLDWLSLGNPLFPRVRLWKLRVHIVHKLTASIEYLNVIL